MLPATVATRVPDRLAVVLAGSGESLTYAQFEARARWAAQALRDAGLRAGDHIAFCLDNGLAFLPLVWGARYAGIGYTPISYRLTPGEIGYIVRDCGARAFLTTADKAEASAEELPLSCPDIDAWFVIGEVPVAPFRPFLPSEQDAVEHFELAETEGEEMLYTSGTTGRPKGVVKLAPPRRMGDPDPTLRLARRFGFEEDGAVYLSPAPLYHAAPLHHSVAMLRVGGTVVVMERFDAEEALRAIETHRVTTSQWVPTMFTRMLKLPPEVRSRYDLSTLRHAVHAAAPCPRAVKRKMIEWWGPIIHEYYGGTEGNGITYCDSTEWLAREGTVGRPLLGELHILDDDGEELPPGAEGTVYFAGPAFEYHGDADHTAGALDPKGRGWTTLGDVGYADDDGYLYLTDRRSHMIVSGGVNIYPREIEDLLVLHPSVADAAVIGVPDPEFGEAVRAVVQLADGIQGSPELEVELIAHCRSSLATIKCPRAVDFRDALPRLPTGKLQKRMLRDEYWRGYHSRLVPE